MHAYDTYLSEFTEPHSMNSHEIGRINQWIGSLALDFQEQGRARGLAVDVVVNDTLFFVADSYFVPKDEHWFVQSRNILLRIRGQSDKEDAVLINAHYDSVPTSPGVTDNGIGVAVTLELIRYFIDHPPQNTIIFLFNAFEEGGLLGAKSFIKHPWFPSVKTFINLEGAGAGGRPIIFRSSSLYALQNLASSGVPFVHASPLGNDMFKTKLLKSDTDYTVFTQNGKPGVDIAFYYPRSHYHTSRDSIAYTTPEALQYMGEIALYTVRGIDKDNGLTHENGKQMVYFDVLGRFLFVYTFTTYQVLNFIGLFGIPAAAIGWAVYTNRSSAAHLSLYSKILFQGILATVVGLTGILVCFGLSVSLLMAANPLVTYGNIYLVAVYMFVACILGLVLSQALLARVSQPLKVTLANPNTGLVGLLGLWWISVVLSVYVGSFQLSFLYFFIFFLASSALSFAFYHFVPHRNVWHLPGVFLCQTLVPATILIENWYLTMDTMRHATVDGTPEVAVYILVGMPIILLVIHLLPWIHVAENKNSSAIVLGVFLVFLFTICSALQPFNAEWSPNKLVFNQFYNASQSTSTVQLISSVGLQDTLIHTLDEQELGSLECAPHLTYQTKCTYTSTDIPLYSKNLDEFAWTAGTTCDDESCTIEGEFTANNTMHCRVLFDTENLTNITEAWVNDILVQDVEIKSLVSYTGVFKAPVTWGANYPANQSMPVTLSCFYDEWTKEQIPAFTSLRQRLPQSAVLLIRGQGLVSVDFARI
ncbi:hypothetical protein CLU79DRAFT_711521 [Phycomyces nitens]|nr:hypothetical protein CLU79DRAFT_711521 [Phycomyces nitens]